MPPVPTAAPAPLITATCVFLENNVQLQLSYNVLQNKV